MTTPATRNVVLWSDFGGVVAPSPEESLHAFAAAVSVPVTELVDAMRKVSLQFKTTDLLEPLERGWLLERQWESRMAAVLGCPLPPGSLSGEWFTHRPVTTAWVDALKGWKQAGVTIGLLSNMPPGWDRIWPEMLDREIFDHEVVSCRAGCRKPDAVVFGAAEGEAGTDTALHILVDDLEDNCAAAREAGWRSVRFQDATQASAEVTEILEGLS